MSGPIYRGANQLHRRLTTKEKSHRVCFGFTRSSNGRRAWRWRHLQGRDDAPAEAVAYGHREGPLRSHVGFGFCTGLSRMVLLCWAGDIHGMAMVMIMAMDTRHGSEEPKKRGVLQWWYQTE
ncbi:unnamed protein product [Linum tenue]|uniref:Uncharacterized protein n=1 Tax=Linum tenue TaxID=586396 RepID=A0AAV0HBR1_9ROSI|nr:unnamed protein product [Linum tenue]